MRVIVRVSMSLVALAAAALSFESLWRLGQLAGYGELAWAYPLVVDLGAASSCAAWLQSRRRQPLLMTWGLLTTSVILNGTVHYLDAEKIAPSWPLVVAVAAVPPMVLGLCVHLSVGLGGPPADTTPALVTGVVTADPEDPVGNLIESGAGRRRLAKELGVTEYQARQLISSRNGATR